MQAVPYEILQTIVVNDACHISRMRGDLGGVSYLRIYFFNKLGSTSVTTRIQVPRFYFPGVATVWGSPLLPAR